MATPNPLRSSLSSFFSTLLSVYDSDSIDCSAYAAKDYFEQVASIHWDRFADPSDCFYARLISLLDIITPSQLLKVCEGFRKIDSSNPYDALNCIHPERGTGLRALQFGCEHGVVPLVISYRHSPDALGRTVSRNSANRFRELLQISPDRVHTTTNTCIVWIDRAIRGLSVDGEWFVRGLLPYCVALMTPLHSFGPDFARPWIWLEALFNYRALSGESLVPRILRRDALLIAVQAMFDPGNMLEKYEYKEHMEAVIVDIFAFGLSVTTEVKNDRKEVVACWNDYKIGIAVALCCGMSAGDMKWDLLIVDDRNPFGNNLFTQGFVPYLVRAGAEMAVGMPADMRVYSLVDGEIALVRLNNDKERFVTTGSLKLLTKLKEVAGRNRIARYLSDELCTIQPYCDAGEDLSQNQFNFRDELAVLASCNVLFREQKKKYTKTEWDIQDGRKIEDLSVTVQIELDVSKALESQRMKKSYNMGRWLQKTKTRTPTETPLNSTGISESASGEDKFFTKGIVVADYKRGQIRVVTRIGMKTILRRLAITIPGDIESAYAVLACKNGHVACATSAALRDFEYWVPLKSSVQDVVFVRCAKE